MRGRIEERASAADLGDGLLRRGAARRGGPPYEQELRMNTKIKKASRHTNQSEGLIFEKSSPGKRAFELPPPDVPAADPAKALGAHHRRAGIEGFPEVSEIQVLRPFTPLSTWNYAIHLRMS